MNPGTGAKDKAGRPVLPPYGVLPVFQRLEKYFIGFPMIGKYFSNGWKIRKSGRMEVDGREKALGWGRGREYKEECMWNPLPHRRIA